MCRRGRGEILASVTTESGQQPDQRLSEPAGDGAAGTSSTPPTGRRSRPLRRWLGLALAVLGAVFLLAQAVPYGRSHTNPRVTAEPRWDTQQTRALAARACFDCHSNLTKWPWYSHVAPVSWLVQRDVDQGRSALNFSEWNKPQDGAGDIGEAISGGSMPPWFYRLMHPHAKLSKADRQRLIVGLAATLRRSPPPGGGG
jgi:mono/diheme cytochrome c family protein